MGKDKFVSKKAGEIAPSLTMALSSRVKELRAQGADIISLDIGEPDFDTPQNIKDAAKKAIDGGFTKYTPEAGTVELRQAIAQKFRRENGISYEPGQIVVSNGAKHSLYNAFLATLNPGDEVIVPSPYWVSYVEQIKLAGGVPVIAECLPDWQLDLGAIEESMTDRTKMVMVNSPNNPTGAVYPEKDLRKLSDIVLPHESLMLADEIYERIVFPPNKHSSIASFSEETKERTITISGASKTFAMTGWRIGYAAGPAPIMKAISGIQGQTTSGPNSIAQKAVVEALNSSEESVRKMAKAYEERRDLVIGLLDEVPGFETIKPRGAFYVFPKVDSHYGDSAKDSGSFAQFLLDKAKVSVIPGSAFGHDECIRISTANSKENIAEGIARVKAALK